MIESVGIVEALWEDKLGVCFSSSVCDAGLCQRGGCGGIVNNCDVLGGVTVQILIGVCCGSEQGGLLLPIS